MKTIILLSCQLMIAIPCLAQVPAGINYQGVARNSTGQVIQNQKIGLKISVLESSATGSTVYTETFAPTTSAFGVFTINIGTGTPVSGTFAKIDWTKVNTKWLKVEMDASGGTNYVMMGSSQLLSVPYALHSNTSTEGKKLKTLLYLSE